MGTFSPSCRFGRTFSLRFKIGCEGGRTGGIGNTIMGGKKVDRSVSRFLIPLLCWLPFTASFGAKKTNNSFDLRAVESSRILSKAKGYLRELPRTVTADSCERSSGDRHDFILRGITGGPIRKTPKVPTSAGMGKPIRPILLLIENP